MSAKKAHVPMETKVYYALEQLEQRGVLQASRRSDDTSYGVWTQNQNNQKAEFQAIVKVEHGLHRDKYRIKWMIDKPIETLQSLVSQHVANCEATIDMAKMLNTDTSSTTLLN